MNASISTAKSAGSMKTVIARIDMLAVPALILPWLAAWWLPEFAQPQSFHDYADQRMWLGLPHAADVLSNLPFLVVGGLGLRFVWLEAEASRRASADDYSPWPYLLLFFGVLLTTFGSAWYHLHPGDATLVWDRLPMALGFAGLVAGTLGDRAPRRAALLTLLFAISGAGTVLYWHATANLVAYLTMQAFFILAALIATAWIPSRYTLVKRVYWAAGAYAVALILERLDHLVFQWTGGLISGHTLKHLTAGAAVLIVYRMLRDRKPQC
jgi:hypothetical protein